LSATDERLLMAVPGLIVDAPLDPEQRSRVAIGAYAVHSENNFGKPITHIEPGSERERRFQMQRWFILLVAALLSACTSTGDIRSDGEKKREVATATADWVAAYDSRNPARIAAMYEPDAVFWGTTSKIIRTDPAAILDYFKDAGKRPDARVAIVEPQQIQIFGDVSINSGSYTFTDLADGKPVATPARYTFVFHRRNGQWRIVEHHSSRIP
jgi:uncharacterized protein (TIGR02246 family)